MHQEGRFYRLSTGRAAHYENIKPHNPSTEDWCIPADMEEGDYLMMDPACEVNEKGTREKNNGNEVIEEGTCTPLDLDPNDVIEADDEILPYAEEDWQDPEQREVPKILEPDLPFTIHTRQNDRTRSKKKYNPYGDDFVVDRIDRYHSRICSHKLLVLKLFCKSVTAIHAVCLIPLSPRHLCI